MRRRLDRAGLASALQGFEQQAPASASEPAPEPARPLLEAWNRSGTAGSGVNVLQGRMASGADRSNKSLVGFYIEREITKTQSKKKLKSARHLVYHREP